MYSPESVSPSASIPVSSSVSCSLSAFSRPISACFSSISFSRFFLSSSSLALPLLAVLYLLFGFRNSFFCVRYIVAQYGNLSLYIAYAVLSLVTSGFQLFKLCTDVILRLLLSSSSASSFAISLSRFSHSALLRSSLFLRFRNRLFKCGQFVHTYRYIKIFFPRKQFLRLFMPLPPAFQAQGVLFQVPTLYHGYGAIVLGTLQLVLCVLFLR